MSPAKRGDPLSALFSPFSIVFTAALALLVIVAVLAVYWTHFPDGVSTDHSRWGQFGDFLGGVLNPIFGFFGFLALLLTLRLQSQELKHSTEELAKSAEALQQQHSALRQQIFENTFFQLLRRFSDLVGAFRYQNLRGREALRQLYVEQLRDGTFHSLKTAGRQDDVALAYEKFYENSRHELGHYFRALYHIFKFIDSSGLTESDKVAYANIARAQLSAHELSLLFYNGLVGEGKEGFRPLIEKYGLLKHLKTPDLLNKSDVENRDFYDQRAFLGYEERQALERRPIPRT